MSGPLKIIKTGQKLIKLFRGETTAKNAVETFGGKTSEATKGRWYTPIKGYALNFAKGEKGERILKSVEVSEKDYNIGNKMYKRIFGENHCIGSHCILPKKNLKDVKEKKFSKGGLMKGHPKLAKKGWK